jgi:hypothetical protein
MGPVEDRPPSVTAARLEIEYLRRLYARACDLIGENTDGSLAEGDAIFRRIFSPDVDIAVTIDGKEVLVARGPEQWTCAVREALCKRFVATQHLIGTQIVEIQRLPASGGDEGEATMTSYLQAWHAGADGTLDIFIGTYHDELRHAPGLGWRIHRMRLVRTSGEVRPLSGGPLASFLAD